METSDNKPLFPLTAEEVGDYREAIKTHIHWLHITKPKTEYWEKEKNIYEGYLKRIEEWLKKNLD